MRRRGVAVVLEMCNKISAEVSMTSIGHPGSLSPSLQVKWACNIVR